MEVPSCAAIPAEGAEGGASNIRPIFPSVPLGFIFFIHHEFYTILQGIP